MDELTTAEAAVIQAARQTLVEAGKRADHMGRMAEALQAAEQAAFRVLNVASSYYGVNLSYEQLHGSPAPILDEVPPEPEPVA